MFRTVGSVGNAEASLVTAIGAPAAIYANFAWYLFYDGGTSSLHSIGLATSSDPGEIEYTRLGEIIRCPWHGWEFDIRTGQSWCDPKRFRAKAYPVNVEPGSAVVKGPYIAETIAVSVDSDYVVVDL